MQLQEALDSLTAASAEQRPAVGALLASIAHDGRSPLSAIELDLFSLEQLLGRLAPGAELGPVLSVCSHIRRCAQDLEQLFEQLEQHGEVLRSAGEPDP